MKEDVLVRLDPDAYKALESKLTPPVVTSSTTDLQAGAQLGIQTVLKLLREGYVVSR